MINRRNAIKEEIKRNLRSISILIIVIILLYKGWSITKLLKLTLSDRVVWAIDFGVYSALLSIFYSIIGYLFIRKKIVVRTEMLNQKEGSNNITLNSDMPESIRLKIEIEGKSRNIPRKLKIVFPYWLDIQTKPKPYVYEQSDNILLVDINHLVENKDEVKLTDYITIDLIKATDEENQESVQSVLELNPFTKLFFIDYESEAINIRIE